MSLSFFIANRLSLRTASGKLQSGIVIAVTGIALSVTVMLVSIAVMMGFKDEIRHKIMGFDSQLTVSVHPSDSERNGGMVDIYEISRAIENLPSHASGSLVIRRPVILKTPEEFSGAVVKGMDTSYAWDFVRENLTEGVIPDYKADSTLYHIIISGSLARDLSVGTGEKIDAYFLSDGFYRARRLKIAGIYDTHFSEYDDTYIFASMPMLAAIDGITHGKGSEYEITGLGSDEEIAGYGRQLSAALLEELYKGNTRTLYTVTDVHTSAALYFNWLALLDTNVVVILSLMSLLACLTLVSSLYILILRRVTMIGILKALGATDRLIRSSFVWLTMRILAVGLIVGNLIGIGIIILQQTTGMVPLDPEAYYLDHVPMELSIPALVLLNVGVVLISAAVLILPSAIITTIPPSKVINYD